MVQTANRQETTQVLKGKILSCYEYLVEHQDTVNAEKVKQLAKKLAEKEFTIAFCGHFSAGKSTMINRVVGENLLPSSPIPTSANLVKVKSGEEYAKVIFKNEKPRLYLAPYDYKMVKNYCKDGDQIEEIEISHQDSQLPSNTVIMDTPGIDSADDAHRVATESAIHLADLIFYVMDYNHVQSELNFLFTKELTEAGKEVYLVINQIDKHSDEELTFGEFQKSVTESFASWGVTPAAIYYTSLKMEEHMFNQFSELCEFIAEKLTQKDAFLSQSIFHSLKKIMNDHAELIGRKNNEEIRPYEEILNELPEKQQAELMESYTKINMNLERTPEGIEQAEKKFELGLADIMKNAYLMPFQTRSLAEAFLESCQPEFKVGFLFTKQKTQEEKQVRLNKFYQDILEKTKSQLEWHLKEFQLGLLKEMKLDNHELIAKAQAFDADFPIELLVNTVKTGARLSGDYLLNYTDDVANEIKKQAKNRIAEFKISYLEVLEKRNKTRREKTEKEFENMERYVKAFAKINLLQAEKHQEKQKVAELLNNDAFLIDDHPLFAQEERDYEVIFGEAAIPEMKSVCNNKLAPVTNTAREDVPHPAAGDRLHHTSDKLRKTSEIVHSLPGFKKLSLELIEKAQRLEHKGFTVALFGAFSAGKSSFANALIGEKVLPVSPNPTTAAINKIKPATDSHPHGTVLVKLKEKSAMLDDLNRALKVFELRAESFADALAKIDKSIGDKSRAGALEKTNDAFLQAFKKGYATFGEQLGSILQTTKSEFGDFVAKEEKSCFVEWIDLYYDCELTRKGITLVDTPGADSINARHTGVAFDFIKNSDAILFVTYYNHAFSKADREFLIQLGRVKDSFQLDKMFFIINAIDLAENEEEKADVIDYVQEQLIKYGVRKPHLYPLSSLFALKEKTDKALAPVSGMASFEKAFYQFISYDLANIAITASETEIRRVNELLGKLIQSAREDAAVKVQKRTNIEKEKAMIKKIIAGQQVKNLEKRLFQEAEELLYYIKQRVFFRFGDFFKESFNPAVLRDDGRNLRKVLQNSLEEFLEGIGFDLAQELRATTVRLDRFAEKITADYQISLIEKLMETNQDLSFSLFEFANNQEIEFQTAFKEINRQLFTKALSYFKNPKSFFEKNEKKFMSDELYQVLDLPADEYLQEERNRLTDHYGGILKEEFTKMLSHMSEQADDFYLSMLSALDGGVPIEQLMKIEERLRELI